MKVRPANQSGGEGVHASEVIELIMSRDERGIDELLRHFGPLMRYVIAPILSDEADREECLSECCMRVWDNIRAYSPSKGSLSAWLTAIARNCALDRARRSKPVHESLDGLNTDLPACEPTPEEALLKQERREALEKAIDALKPAERALFYRKYYYMQSTAQMAGELGMSERAIEGRLRRLRIKLRRALGGDGDE